MAKFGINLYEGGYSSYVSTYTAEVGTSVSTFTGTYTDSLIYEYTSLCTNFDHAPGGASFSGKARLQGHAVVSGNSGYTTIGPAPDLTLTLLIGGYEPTLSIGQLFMSAVAVPHTMYPSYSRSFSLFDVTLSASAQFTSADSCKGQLSAMMTAGSSEVGEGEAPFTLTRGGTCPV